jgi:replicative DNA helicase Mcm
MVLANKGLLSIDEFEKMSVEDQVAMHEGMEQGSVSIAKASIIATLPAKTSILAGGNPKFSRFDPYMPIAKQITIPDTLLSRFDLKFALRDIPDSETDKLVVDHILKSRHDDYEATIPKLSPQFIRKYIAYAKDRCNPELTEESEKILKTFYIKTRKKAEGTTQAIPITLRQFEALMRIAEASAKMQLSQIVRKEDAQRAIKLMRFSLRQLGFDPETGQIDVDRAEGATSSSERGKIRIVMDIINDISSVKKEIHVEEIRTAAKKEGIEDVDEIIEKLKREGMLFEPSPGYVQKV